MVSAALTRSYSVYPPNYIKPTFKKDQQATLIESGEALEIAHTPILPTLSNNTSSEFHDDVVKYAYIPNLQRSNLSCVSILNIQLCLNFLQQIYQLYHEKG